MFRRLKVKDSECVTQRQKIKELENTIALIEKRHKTELDFTVQRYENLLKEKDKLHREELELARGLSGAKLTSDDHHKGMYLCHLNVCTLSFPVHVCITCIYILLIHVYLYSVHHY